MPTLEDAIQAIRSGNKEEGRQILEEILETDENNEEVWLWLSSVVDTDEDREICLENVLALDPDNIVAQRGLEALRSGTFNVHSIGDALEAEGPVAESTFLDEFMISEEDIAEEDFGFDEDEELVMPSTMAKPQAKKGKLNIRLIVLVALILVVIVLILGGLAASMFLGGDNGGTGPSEGQPSQEVPAEGGEQPPTEEVATDTPTPIPTDTPTPTITPFTLPTPLPTEPPTPTATPVVLPTPS